MIVKNLLKTFDNSTFERFSVKIKTWDLYNGFRSWDYNDLEIQNAKVQNIVIYNQYQEIEIQAQIKR